LTQSSLPPLSTATFVPQVHPGRTSVLSNVARAFHLSVGADKLPLPSSTATFYQALVFSEPAVMQIIDVLAPSLAHLETAHSSSWSSSASSQRQVFRLSIISTKITSAFLSYGCGLEYLSSTCVMVWSSLVLDFDNLKRVQGASMLSPLELSPIVDLWRIIWVMMRHCLLNLQYFWLQGEHECRTPLLRLSQVPPHFWRYPRKISFLELLQVFLG